MRRRPKRLGARAAHQAFQHRRCGDPQIGENQRIQSIRKMRIDIEAEELAADFHVLANQNGQAFAIEFKSCTEAESSSTLPIRRREQFDVFGKWQVTAEATARTNKASQLIRQMPFRYSTIRRPRKRLIIAADTDRAEENSAFGPAAARNWQCLSITTTTASSAFDNRANERTAQFDARSDALEEFRRVVKESVGVKSFNAAATGRTSGVAAKR